MAKSSNQRNTLIEKIDTLPPERVEEVEDFVDFLRQKDQKRQLTHAAAKTAEPSLKKVWDNPDDAVYDTL